VQVLPRPKEEEMTKEQILEALPGTGIEIAKRLEVSPVLVNAHLQQLKRMGKVLHKEAVKNGRGRPSFIWIASLTEVVPTDTAVAPVETA
jgi:predicted ArsR family transcriptional regulator